MTKSLIAAAATLTIIFSDPARAAIVEIGDLNFISHFGNASDGLAFLDMSFSVGFDQADALANARLTYLDARLATPDEFDDLFLAAGVTYSGIYTASDGFGAGPPVYLTGAADPGAAALVAALGATRLSDTLVWTDPDGNSALGTTRDFVNVSTSAFTRLSQSPIAGESPVVGWLLVSDSAVVPEPSTGLLVAAGVLGLGFRGRRRRLQ